MHHALEISEILLNIFHHCYSGLFRDTSTLASLATTCRAFKEPALDVLWEEMRCGSPLARCIPEAFYQLPGKKLYSFSRPLTQSEWDILLSYTHRIRIIVDIYNGLDWESVGTILFNPPTTRPLFPSVQTLHFEYTKETMPLLRLPLQSLVYLDVYFQNQCLLQQSLKSFPNFSNNFRKLRVFVRQLLGVVTFSRIESNYTICRWQNLTSVVCSQFALDAHELVHLSRMPALTKLDFTANTTLPPFDTPLFFANLHDMTLRSESLEPISQLLFQIQLPVITGFTAYIINCPSRRHLPPFWAGFQTASSGDTIKSMWFSQPPSSSNDILRSKAIQLSLEDLRPSMAFSNLRVMYFNLGWSVGLMDSNLLTLISAWPRLERLSINPGWGWNAKGGGVTPNGLLRLLEACPSLSFSALAIDTRGVPGLISPRPFAIDVLDSVIEVETVPAIAAFFSGIVSCHTLILRAWGDHWQEVHKSVRDAAAQCS
ncbi:hypothetical protein EV363DRAFT_1402984 [Boletus edulis]|nr:hypothetical protein EV363DRAFT_1402984 [Boletus edulis]